MTSDEELRLSAEALRHVNAGVSLEAAFDCMGHSNAVQARDRALWVLSQAYIAANPADDGEAVTEAWVKELLCIVPPDRPEGYLTRYMNYRLAEGHSIYIRSYTSPTRIIEVLAGDWLLIRDPTRGQLRTLARALGISLTESAR